MGWLLLPHIKGNNPENIHRGRQSVAPEQPHMHLSKSSVDVWQWFGASISTTLLNPDILRPSPRELVTWWWGKGPHLISETTGNGSARPPAMAKIPNGRVECLPFYSSQPQSAGLLYLRRKIHPHYSSRFGEWLDHLHKPWSPLRPLGMCPVACGTDFTFHAFPRHKRAATASSPPKCYLPGVDPAAVPILPHHSW